MCAMSVYFVLLSSPLLCTHITSLLLFFASLTHIHPCIVSSPSLSRYPEVLATIESLENTFKEEVNQVDMEASSLLASQGPAAAVEYATQYSEKTGNNLVKRWKKYFGQMFVKFRDGYVITESAEDTACGCSVGSGPYPQQWYNRIAAETGDHYKVLPDSVTGELKEARFKPVSKTELLKRK
jgi:hypothetical protein